MPTCSSGSSRALRGRASRRGSSRRRAAFSTCWRPRTSGERSSRWDGWHPVTRSSSGISPRRATKALLEDVSGQRVAGFRAPSFSIRRGMEWTFDVLLEEGYSYDSSLFPIRRPDYGYTGGRTVPYRITSEAGTLLELPLATLSLAGARLPAAGGGYLRHLPLAIIRLAFGSFDKRGVPGMFYLHPWDLDTGQPRLALQGLQRVRHYRGLDRAEHRVRRLLGEFRWTSVAAWMAGENG